MLYNQFIAKEAPERVNIDAPTARVLALSLRHMRTNTYTHIRALCPLSRACTLSLSRTLSISVSRFHTYICTHQNIKVAIESLAVDSEVFNKAALMVFDMVHNDVYRRFLQSNYYKSMVCVCLCVFMCVCVCSVSACTCLCVRVCMWEKQRVLVMDRTCVRMCECICVCVDV